MSNFCETLYLTTLRDSGKMCQLHHDSGSHQSGLGDTEEISLEVDGGHGYIQGIKNIIIRSKKVIYICIFL